MGLIDFFKGKLKEGERVNPNREVSRFEMFSAYQPVFRTRSGGIYESQLVRQSIHAHARHAMKLKPTFQGSAAKTMQRSLELGPNEFQRPGTLLRMGPRWICITIPRSAYNPPSRSRRSARTGSFA